MIVRSGEERGGTVRAGEQRSGLQRGAEPTVQSIAFTVPNAQLYPLTLPYLRRGQVYSNAARSYLRFRQGATTYGVDTTHNSIGANCVTWNASLSGATRVNVTLAAGAQTGAAWATAMASALTSAGVTGVTRDGAIIRIAGARDLVFGSGWASSTRRIWGRRRTRFGTGGGITAPSYNAVNGTVSAHLTRPGTAGRILLTGMLDTSGARTGSFRMALHDGPVYSLASKSLTGGVEGLATLTNDVYTLTHNEPIAYGATADKWVSWKTNAAAAVNVEARAFTASPAGGGDHTTAERILIDATSTNPAVAFGASFTNPAGANGQVFGAHFVVVEFPDSNGDYYGDASIGDVDEGEIIGFRGAYNMGTPSTLAAAVLATVTDTPRLPTLYEGAQLLYLESATGGNAADEDFGGGVFDMSDVTISSYPIDQPAPRLSDATVQRFNASTVAGYKRLTFDPPIDLTGVTRVGCYLCAGNIDRVTAPDTISVLFHAQANGTWATGWVDQTTWCDSSDVLGYGANMQYVANGDEMPIADVGATLPANFADDDDDQTFANIPVFRIGVYVPGFAIAA